MQRRPTNAARDDTPARVSNRAAGGTVGLVTSTTGVGSAQVLGPDPNFHVYLAFGQSNMEGFPGIEPQDKIGVNKRFQMLSAVDFPTLGRKKGEWYDAVPPLCRTSTGLCPADYFGRTMVARMPEMFTIGVVNVAVAGCKIELFNKDTYEAYAATTPGLDDEHHRRASSRNTAAIRIRTC